MYIYIYIYMSVYIYIYIYIYMAASVVVYRDLRRRNHPGACVSHVTAFLRNFMIKLLESVVKSFMYFICVNTS